MTTDTPPPTEKKNADGRPVILVVDDTRDSRQLLVSMLRRFTRSEQIEAANGEQALAAYRDKKPCLTFLDIDMPDKDGLAVLRDIRSHDPKAIVIMVTGVGSAANVTESLKLGASGFVIKPYSARRIIDSLEKFSALSGRPSLLVSSA